jgi:cell division protein FtsW (lipid II flippase)
MPWLALIQSIVASGTATSTARRIAYLPEKHVDFIFSTRPEPLSIFWLVVVVVGVAVLFFLLRRRHRHPPNEIS